MPLTVGTAIPAGQTWTVTNTTSAIITSKPAWLTATGTVSGTTVVFTLSGTPTAAAPSFTLTATADNTSVPAGCSPPISGQVVTSASVIVNCITPVIGAWTPNATTNCTTPTIGATVSSTTAVVGSVYTATISVSNATTATVTNLPAWLTQTYAQSGSNGTITITGTPAAGDITAGLALLVAATNNPGACTSASATGLAGGTLIVNAPSSVTLAAPSWAGTASFSQRNITPNPQPSSTLRIFDDGRFDRVRTGTLGGGTDSGFWVSAGSPTPGLFEVRIVSMVENSQSGTYSRIPAAAGVPTAWTTIASPTTLFTQSGGGPTSVAGTVITTFDIEVREIANPANIITFSSGTLTSNATV
jgi:hypothetical protein